MRTLLFSKSLSLSSISKLWMKINSVYKQASIERTSIRKNAAQNAGSKIEDIIHFKKDNITPEQLALFDSTIVQ